MAAHPRDDAVGRARLWKTRREKATRRLLGLQTVRSSFVVGRLKGAGPSSKPRSRAAVGLSIIGFVFAAAACDGGAPSTTGAGRGEPPVVVASYNFPESELLAEIYAQALRTAGVPVRVEAGLGTREMVMPAFQQGLVDVIPEYIGSAYQAIAVPGPVDMSEPSAAAAALSAALMPWHAVALSPSPAEDENGLVVRREVADKYGLRSVSDLHPLATRLVLTGPPECTDRAYCLMGFERTYGLHFRRFLALDTAEQRVTALDQGVADVAVLFSTDAQLAAGDLVFLRDDLHLQPADNVTPLVTENAIARYGALLTGALDGVSRDLSTSGLVFLNWRVTVEARPTRAEAHGWLVRHGLVPRGKVPGQSHHPS